MIKQISSAFHIGFLVDPTSIKNESLFIEIEDFCLFKNELKHFINEVQREAISEISPLWRKFFRFDESTICPLMPLIVW